LFIPLPDYENRLRLLGIMLASAKAEFAASDLAMLADLETLRRPSAALSIGNRRGVSLPQDGNTVRIV
jgi:hypothetical protein